MLRVDSTTHRRFDPRCGSTLRFVPSVGGATHLEVDARTHLDGRRYDQSMPRPRLWVNHSIYSEVDVPTHFEGQPPDGSERRPGDV